MRKQHSFIKGTAILIMANAISKILGAIFKIPLTYILKEEGMAIFNTAMGVYSTVLSFIIAGFPLALSRLVAEQYALKKYSSVKKTVKLATAILCTLGLLGTLIMYFFADFFAISMKDPHASLAIKVIAPSVFFVAWGNIYKSYYQGCVNMIPTAISQIIEAFIKLIAGFMAAYLLKDALIEITSAGAISGITLGEIIATFILFGLYIPTIKEFPKSDEKISSKKICASLASIAVPMLICSCISGPINLLDVASVRNSLMQIRFTPQSAESFLLKYSSYTTCFDDLKTTLRLSMDGARWLYGAYSGFALTLFHLPVGIIGALGTGVLPVISGAIAKKDTRLVEKTVTLALKLTMIIALPATLILGLFSEQLLDLIFNNTSSALLLQQLSPCLIFLCISQLLMTVLHASGRIIEPFLYSLVGMALKLLCNFFLIPIARINISGSIIGAFCSFFVMTLFNSYAVKKHLKINIKVFKNLIKPTICALIMTLVMLLVNQPFSVIFKSTALSMLATLFIGTVAYLLSLTGFEVINVKELKGASL